MSPEHVMWHTDSCYNGEQAISNVKQAYEQGNVYSLIIMDQSMPFMDGTEASRRIRKFLKRMNQAQPYIIACTGHTEDLYIRQAWQYGMDEVLPKPAKIELIQMLLEEVISNE